jgi:REP element-mobilizing transposase RayT
MARVRKRRGQLPLRFSRRGGARPGAGRPRKRRRASEAHKKRPTLKASQPVHVTIRVSDDIARLGLRKRSIYKAVREAMLATYGNETCRIVHTSIQDSHLHLLVEADNRMALARGMQAFQISAAKHINAAVSNAGSWWERRKLRLKPKRRKGSVFPDRYHEEIIKTPRQARNALAYVLNNWRKHKEHRKDFARTWLIDPFSTGWSFDGWKEREDEPFVWKLRASYEPIMSWRPRTWLLSEGWRRYGLVSVHEVPGPRESVFPR